MSLIPQHHFYERVVYFALPEGVIICHTFGFSTAGFHDQMFCLGDEGSNVRILSAQQFHCLGPFLLDTFTELLDTWKKHAVESTKVS